MLTERSVIKGTGRNAHKIETRRRILEAALSLYSRHGILDTRSAEIAREAGVAQGTVFLHFPSQDELAAAVIGAFGDGLCGRLHELAARGGGLTPLLEAQLQALAEREDFYTRLVVEAPLLPEAARTALVMIQSTVSYHLARAAESGMASGAIKRMPIHLLFNTWIGLVHHYLVNRELFAPGASVLERRGPELVAHFMVLVSPGTGPEGGQP